MSSVKSVFIWTRFTTANQREESHEAQERKVRQMLDRLGIDHTNAILINESAERGDDDDRETFEEFLGRIKRGEVGICGVDEQVRFSRGTNLEAILNDIVFHGGRFLSCCGVDTDRPGWQDQVGLKQIAGRMEVRATSSRVRRSMEMRVEKPDGAAGDHPYGYTSEFENKEAALKYTGRGPKPAKRVIIDPAAAAVVSTIFQRFVNDNWSIGRTSRWWNSERDKHPLITKGDIQARHVSAILRNKKYVGQWEWGKTTTLRDGAGKKKQSPLRPHQSAVLVERPNLRIISDELWNGAQAKLVKLKAIYGMKAKNGRRGPAKHYRLLYEESVLLGKVHCHLCSGPFQVIGSRKGVRRLGCANHVLRKCPVAVGLAFAKAEQAIVDTLAAIVTSYPEWMALAIDTCRNELIQAAKTAPNELVSAEQRLAEVDVEIANLVKSIKKGLDLPEIHDAAKNLKAEQASLQSKITQLRRCAGSALALPDDAWFRQQLAELAGILRTGRMNRLVREMIYDVSAEEVKSPGKCRGYMRLHFKISGWPMLKQILADKLPPHVLNSLSCGGKLSSEEIVVDVGAPTNVEMWAPKIVEWRNAKVPWAEIVKRTGLQLANAYYAYKRYLRGTAAA